MPPSRLEKWQGNAIRAYIYLLIALVAGSVLLSTVFRYQSALVKRIAIAWAVVIFLFFFMPGPALCFITSGFALVLLKPRLQDARLQYAIALLPALPISAVWRVSPPGIETLMWMDYVRLLGLCLLFPLYMNLRITRPRRPGSDAALISQRLFKMLLIFLVATLLLSFRGMNLTSIVRMLIESVLGYFLLVLVVFRLVRGQDAIDKILFGILVSGVILALMSCVEQVTKWKLFNEIQPSLFYWEHFSRHVRDYRWGMMRTPVSMTPIPFGFLMAICLVISIYFVGRKEDRGSQYHGSHLITLVLAAGLLFSGSRGAWMTAGVMMLVLLFFDRRFKALRGLVVLLGITGLFSLSAILTYISESDPYGTFQYRLDLFSNALTVVRERPFWGAMDFMSHPALEESRQGEGIIDIVNSYLRIALQYGLPLLALLVFVFVKTALKLIKVQMAAEKADEFSSVEWQSRCLLAILLGSVFLISSVSMVDRIPHYLWLICVLCLSFLMCVPSSLQR